MNADEGLSQDELANITIICLNDALLGLLPANEGIVVEMLGNLVIVWSDGRQINVTPYQDTVAYQDAAQLKPLSHLTPNTRVKIQGHRVN